MKRPFKLLVVEDNNDDLLFLKELMADIAEDDLFDTQIDCIYLSSVGQTLEYLNISRAPDMILLDLTLPDRQGLDTLKAVRRTGVAERVPIIILTSLDDKEMGVKAVRSGAQEYLVKSAISASLLGNAIRYTTERHRLKMEIEEENTHLEQSENRFISIIASSPDGMIIVDAQGIIQFMNPAAETLLGREQKDVLGKTFDYPMDRERPTELEIDRPGGDQVTAEIRSVEIEWQGKPSQLVSVREITRYKLLQQAFLEEKERLDVTLRSIADGVIAIGSNGSIRIINWMAAELTGWEQEHAIGRQLAQVLVLEDRTANSRTRLGDPAAKILKSGKVEASGSGQNWILIANSGNEIPVEYSCAPIMKGGEVMGAVWVLRDVSEKKELEEESVRAQNLEALGVLAGGLAHEYNNILTSTLGYISLAKKFMLPESKMAARLNKVEKAGLRAKEISSRLLTFSRGGEPVKTAGDIVKAIKRAVRLVSKPAGIKVKWHVDKGIWPTVFDPEQICLACRNIVLNAYESMPSGGTISISVANSKTAELKLPRLKKGNYIEIAITDSGCGISEEDIANVFAPYFSTRKKAGGMGLTTAYSIVRRHGGWIRIKSPAAQGKGTTITVFLPANMPEKMAVPETVPPRAAPLPTCKEKVLVMDDDIFVREVAQELLETLDYEVVVTENGEEAVREYRTALNTGTPFAAVILDLVVPVGMGGKECIQELREIDPNVKAIVSSGYSNDPVIANYRQYGFRGVLPKPYQIQELNSVLESL